MTDFVDLDEVEPLPPLFQEQMEKAENVHFMLAPQNPSEADLEAYADGLDAAADVIDSKGWCQNTFIGQDGTVCAEQAMWVGYGLKGMCGQEAKPTDGLPLAQFNKALAMLALIVKAHGARTGASVAGWNDEDATTKEQVVDTLRFVAKEFRMGKAYFEINLPWGVDGRQPDAVE